MASFLELFEELAKVSREALNCDTCIPRRGNVEDIGFCFGPPSKGRIAFYIIRGERKYLLGKLCDCYPVFTIMRGWMERAVTPTSIGRRRSETITIECDDGVIELSVCPTDLEVGSSYDLHYRMVGILCIRHVGHIQTTHECFCNVETTIFNLYSSLQSAFNRYARHFDDKDEWIIFDRDETFRKGRPTSMYLKEQIRSEKIEFLGRNRQFRKK